MSPPDRSSALEPWATSFPTCITPRWVHICSTSASRWLETSTVVPSSRERPDQLPHLARALGVEPVGRLVEHQQVLGGEQRAGDREPLPHPERVGAEPLVGRGQKSDPVERGVDPSSGRRRVRRPVGGVEPVQVAPSGEVGMERRALDQGAHRRQHRGRPRRHRLAEQLDPAGRRRDEGEQHPDGRRLPRPVGAEEAVDRAGGHLEVDRVDHGLRPEALGESARADREIGHRCPSACVQLLRCDRADRDPAVVGEHRGEQRAAAAGGRSPRRRRRRGACRACPAAATTHPRPAGRRAGWRPARWSSPCRRPWGRCRWSVLR